MNKKAMSDIVTIIFIIGVALVVVGVVWYAVNIVIETQTKQIHNSSMEFSQTCDEVGYARMDSTSTCDGTIKYLGRQKCCDGNCVNCVSNPPDSICGDGTCDNEEDCSSCSEDCVFCENCSDGIQNQDETGVDCGGVCPACHSFCEENWNCTDWSDCVRGEKTRDCVDINNCSTIKDKPNETEICQSSYWIKTIYQGGLNIPDERLEWIANNVDLIVTSSGENTIDNFKSFSSEIPILIYIKAKGIHSSYPYFNYSIENNLLWKDIEGNLIIDLNYGWYLADFRNQLYSEILIDLLEEPLSYYDGIMLDEASLMWLPSLSGIPANLDRFEEYQAYHNILRNIKENYPEKIIVFNGYCHWVALNETLKDLTGIDFLDVSDAISFETFTNKFNGNTYGSERIIRHIHDFVNITDNLDKNAAFIDFGLSDDYKTRMSSLATYLLVQNKNSYYLYTSGTEYIEPYPEYKLDIGTPLKKYIQQGMIFSREYEGATTILNLDSKDYTVSNEFSEQLKIEGGGSFENKGTINWELIKNRNLNPLSGIVVR